MKNRFFKINNKKHKKRNIKQKHDQLSLKPAKNTKKNHRFDVDLLIFFKSHISLSAIKMAQPDHSPGGFLGLHGRCLTFDSSANGFGRGEGGGAVLLGPPGEEVEMAALWLGW